PEWLDVGEDMYLNHRMAQSGARIELVTDAVAYWRIRPTLRSTWTQYARYAEGDARGGLYPERHLLRFATYLGLLGAVRSRRAWALAAAAGGGVLYARRPLRRAWRRVAPGSRQRVVVLALVPALMAFVDLAKMAGY